MKKSSPASKSKKAAPGRSRKAIVPVVEPLFPDNPADETSLTTDQFSVVARDEEAASSGHRIEAIKEDDEHNAEKLVEEGLHGFLRASPNRSRKAK